MKLSCKNTTMKISITNEHIAKGKPADGFQCPLALAISQYTGAQTCISGNEVGLGPTYNNPYQKTKLPQEAEMFVRNFDEGIIGDPFEFEITILTFSFEEAIK